MPGLKIYRVFVSHAWKYHADYDRFVKMLNAAPRFRRQWHNYSVPADDPLHTVTRTKRELEKEIREQIAPTHVVVILSGMYVAYSEWIQKEIDIALEMGKPIIAVRPWGQQRVPVRVQEAADAMVGWNTSSIVDAIRRNAL